MGPLTKTKAVYIFTLKVRNCVIEFKLLLVEASTKTLSTKTVQFGISLIGVLWCLFHLKYSSCTLVPGSVRSGSLSKQHYDWLKAHEYDVSQHLFAQVLKEEKAKEAEARRAKAKAALTAFQVRLLS